MAEGRFVSYLRVSTAKQGHSGLGLEAQRKAVAADMPSANRLTVGIMAMVADEERRMIL
jgi:DNA invertase Pin-like site-specific DNA recombinase